MNCHLRVLAGEKRQRFFGHVRATDVLPVHHLIRIARARDQYSPQMRAAALRNLTAKAGCDITMGRPFAERRRLVRSHFGV
jgi:hypothetical protein